MGIIPGPTAVLVSILFITTGIVITGKGWLLTDLKKAFEADDLYTAISWPPVHAEPCVTVVLTLLRGLLYSVSNALRTDCFAEQGKKAKNTTIKRNIPLPNSVYNLVFNI